jgi:hypothetical protein
VFVGFGIFSLLLSLFEDSGAKVPGIVEKPAPAEIIEPIAATEQVPGMPAVPAPVVALALGESTVALASSAPLEVPVTTNTSISVGAPTRRQYKRRNRQNLVSGREQLS